MVDRMVVGDHWIRCGHMGEPMTDKIEISDEAVEVAAVAGYDAVKPSRIHGIHPWEDVGTWTQEQFRIIARAAILAYEATPEMVALRGDAERWREPLRWFADIMEHELRRNDYKGGWHADNQRSLMRRLRDEFDELEQARHSLDIIKEAADVANFAMMIADNERTAMAQRD